MELNREQVVNALEKWMQHYDGKITNFATLGNAIGLIEKLDDENKKLRSELEEVDIAYEEERQEHEKWLEEQRVLFNEAMQHVEADIVRRMREKLFNRSEFLLRADNDGGLLYVDFCMWFDETAKELLEENK